MSEEKDLGMGREITRRDFLNGVAIGVGGTLVGGGIGTETLLAAAALDEFAPEKAPDYYPPARMGMRGNHEGTFTFAHRLRDGEGADAFGEPADTGETYDLVVVGGGISGLAAAYFFRNAAGRNARILILDNHDDFGGHAKRNEFRVDGRLILGYGGSESLQSPKANFSKNIAEFLIKKLGVDVARFEKAFDRDLYPSLKLSRGVFFARESFGRDVLVTGDPQPMVSDDIRPEQRNGRPLAQFIADFPVSS